MKEIEAKVLEVDVEDLIEKLQDIGTEKVFEEKVKSEFYDFEDGRIEENGQIRLRSIGEETSFITRKKDVQDDRAKVKEEIEFNVDSKDQARKFLNSIGLNRIEDGEKKESKMEEGFNRICNRLVS